MPGIPELVKALTALVAALMAMAGSYQGTAPQPEDSSDVPIISSPAAPELCSPMPTATALPTTTPVVPPGAADSPTEPAEPTTSPAQPVTPAEPVTPDETQSPDDPGVVSDKPLNTDPAGGGETSADDADTGGEGANDASGSPTSGIETASGDVEASPTAGETAEGGAPTSATSTPLPPCRPADPTTPTAAPTPPSPAPATTVATSPATPSESPTPEAPTAEAPTTAAPTAEAPTTRVPVSVPPTGGTTAPVDDLAPAAPADPPGDAATPAGPPAAAAPTDPAGTAPSESGTTAAETLGWGTPNRVDEFDGGLEQWSLYDGPGHAGNGIRSPGQATVSNGVLTISGTGEGTTEGMAWNPGQKYGRWEGRMKADVGPESYNALFLLWPDAENFPVGGEIDFAEIMSADRQTTNIFLHYGADNSQISGEVSHDATQWTNWAVEWKPEKITAFVNGKEWWSTTETDKFPPGPMHLCIQLDWFPDGSTGSSAMHVDWVKQYSLDGAAAPAAGEQVTV